MYIPKQGDIIWIDFNPQKGTSKRVTNQH